MDKPHSSKKIPFLKTRSQTLNHQLSKNRSPQSKSPLNINFRKINEKYNLYNDTSKDDSTLNKKLLSQMKRKSKRQIESEMKKMNN